MPIPVSVKITEPKANRNDFGSGSSRSLLLHRHFKNPEKNRISDSGKSGLNIVRCTQSGSNTINDCTILALRMHHPIELLLRHFKNWPEYPNCNQRLRVELIILFQKSLYEVSFGNPFGSYWPDKEKWMWFARFRVTKDHFLKFRWFWIFPYWANTSNSDGNIQSSCWAAIKNLFMVF